MNRKLKLFNYILNTFFGNQNLKYCAPSKIVSNKIDLENWEEDLRNTMKIIPNFITADEEKVLIEEVDPYLKRLRYEQSHWDDAIHNYRETEKRTWSERNMKVINRIRENAFPVGMSQLLLIHILDLSADGWIKPHLDSVRFCGEIIAGLSLLTDSVMKLTMINNEKLYKDFLLPQRSLYIMSGASRYHYNHEILKNEESYFEGKHIVKGRRISIICRSKPKTEM